MIAPLLPHVTEEIYDQHFKTFDGIKSIHLSSWPDPLLTDETSKNDGTLVKDITTSIRRWKSEHGIPLNKELAFVGLVTDSEVQTKLEPMVEDIVETVRAQDLKFEDREDIEERATAVKPIKSRIGPEFKRNAAEVNEKVLAADPATVYKALNEGGFEIELGNSEKIILNEEFIILDTTATLKGQDVESVTVGNIVILIRE
jgi:valyl-tRNA synthetase